MEILKSKHLVFYFGIHDRLKSEEILTNCFFSLFVTDTTHFWILQQKEPEFKAVCGTQNPSIEAPSTRILRHIIDSVKGNHWKSKNIVKGGQTVLKLTIDSNLSRLPFKWEAELLEAEATLVNSVFTGPLLSLCSELQRQVGELFSGYHYKDKELNKLALNYGIRLSPNKKFPDFDTQQAFQAAMASNEEGVKKSAESGSDLFVHQHINQLLVRLMPTGTETDSARTSDRREEEERKKVTSKPPAAAADVPAKPKTETEEERRLQLKKKLEAEAVKPKDKKKKRGLF